VGYSVGLINYFFHRYFYKLPGLDIKIANTAASKSSCCSYNRCTKIWVIYSCCI